MPKEAATFAAAARSGLSGRPTQKEWRRGKNFSSAFLSISNFTRGGKVRLYATDAKEYRGICVRGNIASWPVLLLTFVSVDESRGD